MPTELKYLACLLLLVVVVVLLLPVNPWEIKDARRAQTRNDLTQLVTAVRAYRSEYGKYPVTQTPGTVETDTENAALLQTLSGHDSKGNAKGIVFFDVRSESSKNGIKSASGALLDAWGNYYRVRFDADEDGSVKNPYSGEPHQLHTDVVTWSVGKDGWQGRSGNASLLRGSDDIVSWE